MSSTQATLTLVMKAQNLATTAVKSIQDDLDKIGTKATDAGSKVSGAFKGLGGSLSNALGNAVQDLSSGGSLDSVLLAAGAYMAGELAEQFGGNLIEKIAGSSFVEGITGALTALGTAMGGIIDAGIAVGMAALPLVLVGIIVAAIAYLILNPDVMVKISELGQSITHSIALAITDTVSNIVGALVGAFGTAFDGVTKAIGGAAGWGVQVANSIVSGLSSLPGKLSTAISAAFRSINVDVGAFHVHAGKIDVDMPALAGGLISTIPGLHGFAAGGMVGLHGPELALVGERGPEMVIPNNRLGSAVSGVTIQGVSERDILDMVDRGLYFRLRRAGTT